MSKREELLTKKVQHTEKQIASVKAEAQMKLKAGNKAGGSSEIARKHLGQARTAYYCSKSASEEENSAGKAARQYIGYVR